MDDKSGGFILGLLIAGCGAIGWGICIGLGFWLVRKFVCDPLDKKIDQARLDRDAKEISERVARDMEKQGCF